MHHAHLIVGEIEEAERLFDSYLLELGLARAGNPDFFLFDTETFGVGEARNLSTLVGKKAFGEKKVFLVKPVRYTLEAQNALLKTLEEPSEGTHIFLIAREREIIIPTLLSRLQVITTRERGHDTEVEKFVRADIQGRLKIAEKFSLDRSGLSRFLDNLLAYLREEKIEPEILRRIARVRAYADLPSVSGRLIIEHLSFVV